MFYKHKNGIGFKKLEKEFLPRLKALKDESWFGTVNTACINMSDQERWFEKINNDKTCLFFIAYLGEEQVPVGLYGISEMDPISKSCSFTHSIFYEFRGKGYGKRTLEAGIDLTFEVFNMRRIETWILSNNHAEAKSTLGVGFLEEGIKRQAVYKCGEYLDCRLFGLLRSEWENSDRIKLLGKPCNLSYTPKCK